MEHSLRNFLLVVMLLILLPIGAFIIDRFCVHLYTANSGPLHEDLVSTGNWKEKPEWLVNYMQKREKIARLIHGQ